ncbi:tail fiber assembly protein [Escherichia fergusonii]|uniref:tail fiber assembly protein n=1 Tax=Escherichia fergusonii TaxID=564 RepID=UPI001495C8B2|nr:tail fiber assembly protein [Escherichia fergusonii]HBE5783641.1 tail fiber assembly protein [Escherichia coli]EFF0771138.1 tail fiber assembly protein [Escherichia fergusonii]MCO7968896.1 tail fiber assembly protein [Escherichia fergusonii]QKD67765.1 phage tail protein [Escherichia fergusonii]QLN40253.1 tail fiber assembly protein [Escherichia fergusonii]
MKEENIYYYSAENNAFYPLVLKPDYEDAGTWPSDAVPISHSWYTQLLEQQANGQVIKPNEYGQPVLTDPPPPSVEDLKRQAENIKVQLLAEAESAILPLERAVRLNMATDEERIRLESWERYSVLVSRVDTTSPEWPDKPE